MFCFNCKECPLIHISSLPKSASVCVCVSQGPAGAAQSLPEAARNSARAENEATRRLRRPPAESSRAPWQPSRRRCCAARTASADDRDAHAEWSHRLDFWTESSAPSHLFALSFRDELDGALALVHLNGSFQVVERLPPAVPIVAVLVIGRVAAL